MKALDAKLSNPLAGGPSFSLKNRIFRALWTVVWRLCGAWTPVFMHPWRRFLLRLFGAKIAKTAKIYPAVEIWYPPHLEMGDHACLGAKVKCYCMDYVRLASHAIVSQGAHLCAGTHDVDDPHFQLVTRPILIGANAWIAAEAFVGPGVTVHEGAVLGARAVTVKDLDPWSIYVGNPARKVRSRKQEPH